MQLRLWDPVTFFTLDRLLWNLIFESRACTVDFVTSWPSVHMGLGDPVSHCHIGLVNPSTPTHRSKSQRSPALGCLNGQGPIARRNCWHDLGKLTSASTSKKNSSVAPYKSYTVSTNTTLLLYLLSKNLEYNDRES